LSLAGISILAVIFSYSQLSLSPNIWLHSCISFVNLISEPLPLLRTLLASSLTLDNGLSTTAEKGQGKAEEKRFAPTTSIAPKLSYTCQE
jgi:hypothetical protein